MFSCMYIVIVIVKRLFRSIKTYRTVTKDFKIIKKKKKIDRLYLLGVVNMYVFPTCFAGFMYFAEKKNQKGSKERLNRKFKEQARDLGDIMGYHGHFHVLGQTALKLKQQLF